MEWNSLSFGIARDQSVRCFDRLDFYAADFRITNLSSFLTPLIPSASK